MPQLPIRGRRAMSGLAVLLFVSFQAWDVAAQVTSIDLVSGVGPDDAELADHQILFGDGPGALSVSSGAVSSSLATAATLMQSEGAISHSGGAISGSNALTLQTMIGAVSLMSVDVGSLDIGAGATISDSLAGTHAISVTGTTTLLAADGTDFYDIDLSDADVHDFAAGAVFDATGEDIAIDDVDGIVLGDVTSNSDVTADTTLPGNGGDFTLRAGGDVVVEGALTVSDDLVIETTGSIVDNSFASILVNDATTLTGSNITLDGPSNIFGSTLSVTGDDVALVDQSGVVLGDSAVTSISLSAGGTIADASGATIEAGVAALHSGAGGNIALNDELVLTNGNGGSSLSAPGARIDLDGTLRLRIDGPDPTAYQSFALTAAEIGFGLSLMEIEFDPGVVFVDQTSIPVLALTAPTVSGSASSTSFLGVPFGVLMDASLLYVNGSVAVTLDGDLDGLSDSLELAGCSDPLDADSDDDGIADGDEDANGNGFADGDETDLCDSDSDGDGLQDGTELGVTAGVADPDGAGPAAGTALGSFVPDADPTTTTDPNLRDSDGDGFSDAKEDVNKNGAVDVGEMDPLFALPFAILSRVGAGSSPFGFAAADLDGDGAPDLLVGNTGDDTVSVLTGLGDGSFTSATFGVSGTPFSLLAAPFDAGASPDLVYSDGVSDVVVLPGNGDGTFGSESSFLAAFLPATIAAGTVDADATLDLLVADVNGGSLNFLAGNGDGSFQLPTGFPALGVALGLGVADLDGDLALDAVVQRSFGVPVVLLGNGDGTFGAAVALPFGTPAATSALALGDLDDDGAPDVVTSAPFQMRVYLGNGNGSFANPISSFEGPFDDLAVGDVDGDGFADVVAAGAGDTLEVLLGNGDGTLQAPLVLETPGDPVALLLVDFDADGDLDIATANMTGDDVSVFLNLGPDGPPVPTAGPWGLLVLAGLSLALGRASLRR